MKKKLPDNNIMIPIAVTTYDDTLALLSLSPLASKTKLLLFTASNGVDFALQHEVKVLSESGKTEPLTHTENFHIATDGDTRYLTYVRTVRNKPERVFASSQDLKTFTVIKKTPLVTEALAMVPDHFHKGHFVGYIGNGSIRAAATKDFDQWHITGPLLDPRHEEFDSAPLRIIGATTIDAGIVTIYDATDYASDPRHLMVGAALFANDQPYRLLWRSAMPVWETTLTKGDAPAISLGTVCRDGQVYQYWRTQQNKVLSVTLPVSMFGPQRVEPATALERHPNNPIITPNPANHWECEATFNPAATCIDGTVHLLYRAIGSNGMSYLGYASSKDGVHFATRSNKPAYIAPDHYTKPSVKRKRYVNTYMSGGSWSGCEDPRMVKIDDTIYVTYTAFDGYHPPGMALTSIPVADFLEQHWDWQEPILISKPHDIQKNWVMFPEKIHGKYAFLHNINPIIRIDYFDDPRDAEMAIESRFSNKGDQTRWDNLMRGVAAPPLNTAYGWLVLYHAMDKRDPNRYKLGAMLLDHDDPTKILHRCDVPVLEPNEWYENEGAKHGVVFACGSVIKDGTLFVYYGGADSVACVATSPLDTFLETLMNDSSREPDKLFQATPITITIT